MYDDGTGPGLYIAADYAIQHNVFDQCVVRWNGTQWSSVGGGVTSPPNSACQVRKLAVFDDGSGSGPELYAAGAFSAAGGVPVRNVAKWNGHRWAPLGAGIGFAVDGMAVFDDDRGHSLFFSGDFQTVGGGTSPSLVQWVACPSCYANCDASGTPPRLNVADFTCFLKKFASRDPYANCNVDAAIDVLDFTCFLQKFAAGCP